MLSIALPAHFRADCNVCSGSLYELQATILLNGTIMYVSGMYLHKQK